MAMKCFPLVVTLRYWNEIGECAVVGEPRSLAVAFHQFQRIEELDRAHRPAEHMRMHGDVEAARGPAEPRPVRDDAFEDAREGFGFRTVADVN
jgi:hypothetical protein